VSVASHLGAGLAGVLATVGATVVVQHAAKPQDVISASAAVASAHPLYAWPVTWYVTPVRLTEAIQADTINPHVLPVGNSAQACAFASDTEAVNGHRWVRRVLRSDLSPNLVCAIAFRWWDSAQTAKYGGAWP
jgi:hypothetical protein